MQIFPNFSSIAEQVVRVMSPPGGSELTEEAIDCYTAYVNRLKSLRYTVLSIGFPLLIVFVIFGSSSTGFSEPLFELYKSLFPENDPRWFPVFRLVLVGLIFFLIPYISYYFFIAARIQHAEGQLHAMKEEYQARLLKTADGRLDFLYRELRKLTNDSARVFFENEARYRQALEWIKESGALLDQGLNTDLNEVQYILTALRELTIRENREQKNQKLWQYAAVAIILAYILGLAFVMRFVGYGESPPIPIFGIPLWVVMWGAIGSLAAILYRFYTEQQRVNLSSEVRWLIARPIIGIFMSAVAYLTVQSGLILLGAPPESGFEPAQIPDSDPTANATRLAAIVCFLAGFSDRVYLGVIDLLVERTFPLGQKKENPEGVKNKSTNKTIFQPKANLSGLWTQDREANGAVLRYQIYIVQNAYELTGKATLIKIGNGKYDDIQVFDIDGIVYSDFVTLNLRNADRVDLLFATSLLKIKNDGQCLEGSLTHHVESAEEAKTQTVSWKKAA
ncbi:MAG: hypothetical protein HY785_20945 [Oscillatoriophycideae cyanobacterium NC_groundwater_1537_Pr4_S-0.65um_50_18]|nr:hypothetical protein [Oscillatoriophycideae cyanobacterium NC_groundwater_1537_Pr4_S-0.65um_50_18]